MHNPCEIVASEWTRPALDIMTLESVQGDTEVRKSVLDGAVPIVNFDVDTRGLSYTASASILQRFPIPLRSCGKFPKPAEQAVLWALGNEHFVIVPHNTRAQRMMGAWFLFGFDGQTLRIARSVRCTVFLHRALIARRILGGADHCTEFHNRLIIGTCFTFWQHGLGEVPQLIFDAGLRDIVTNIKETRDNANNIAIEHGMVAIISNGSKLRLWYKAQTRVGI